MTLESRALTFTYGAESVLTDIDLVIPEGRITALVGANGSGKSTILKNLARLLKPTRGSVVIDGKDIHTMGSKEVARRISILPQKPEAPDGLRVAELVAYGRFSWQSPLAQLNAIDRAKISSALELTGMTKFAERELSTLSGGQRQRAWIAMALAQDSGTMLLDEPTTFLDLAHQFEVLTLLRSLNTERDKTIVMVLHDLNQAASFADNMIVISSGRVLRHGPPSEVMVPEVIAEAFGVVVDFIEDRKSGNRLVVPVALIE